MTDTSFVYVRPFKLLSTVPDRLLVYSAKSVLAVESQALARLLSDLQNSVRNRFHSRDSTSIACPAGSCRKKF
jgi:hypothetical protein